HDSATMAVERRWAETDPEGYVVVAADAAMQFATGGARRGGELFARARARATGAAPAPRTWLVAREAFLDALIGDKAEARRVAQGLPPTVPFPGALDAAAATAL